MVKVIRQVAESQLEAGEGVAFRPPQLPATVQLQASYLSPASRRASSLDLETTEHQGASCSPSIWHDPKISDQVIPK